MLRIDLKDYSNPTNSLSNGSCCDPRCALNSMAAQCCTNDSCNLATRICFRVADHPHTPEGECTRGEFTSLYLRHSNNPSGNFYVRGPTAPNVRHRRYYGKKSDSVKDLNFLRGTGAILNSYTTFLFYRPCMYKSGISLGLELDPFLHLYYNVMLPPVSIARSTCSTSAWKGLFSSITVGYSEMYRNKVH